MTEDQADIKEDEPEISEGQKSVEIDYYSSLPLVPRGRRRSLGGLENLIGKWAPLEKVQQKTDGCSFENSDIENLKNIERQKSHRKNYFLFKVIISNQSFFAAIFTGFCRNRGESQLIVKFICILRNLRETSKIIRCNFLRKVAEKSEDRQAA